MKRLIRITINMACLAAPPRRCCLVSTAGSCGYAQATCRVNPEERYRDESVLVEDEGWSHGEEGAK